MTPGSGEKIGTAPRMRSSSGSGRSGGGVDTRNLPSDENDERRQERPGRDDRTLDAEPRDQHWSRGSADAHRREHEHLDDTKHPGEHLIRNRALNEREPGDVHDRAAYADEPEQQDRDGRRGPEAEDDQRNAPEDDPEHEGRAESSCAGQRESDYRSDERSDSDCRVEDADPAGSEAEEFDRRDDDEHLYSAGDRMLRRDQADHHAQGRLPRRLP